MRRLEPTVQREMMRVTSISISAAVSSWDCITCVQWSCPLSPYLDNKGVISTSKVTLYHSKYLLIEGKFGMEEAGSFQEIICSTFQVVSVYCAKRFVYFTKTCNDDW